MTRGSKDLLSSSVQRAHDSTPMPDQFESLSHYRSLDYLIREDLERLNILPYVGKLPVFDT